MDTIQKKCLACREPFRAVNRRHKYCSHNCRPSSQNAFRGPLHRGAENPDLACLQPIENIDAAPGHFQEFRSSASFRFEEYPERPQLFNSSEKRLAKAAFIDGK